MLLTIVSYFFAFYVVTKLHWGSEMSFGWNLLADHWHILAIIILLHLAFISGLAMLTTLFHSNTLSITFGMFACFGMGSILDGFLYRVLHFHIVKYFVTTNLKNMSPGISGKPMWLALSVALVLTILYNSIGAIWFSKRDAA